MPHVQETRTSVLEMLRAVPFHPFAISLDNGDRVIVEHPENIAFDPTANGDGPARFFIISSQLVVHSTFHKVTSVTLVDRGQ